MWSVNWASPFKEEIDSLQPASRIQCNIAFGELVVNFSDTYISNSIHTVVPVLVDMLQGIPFLRFDRTLSWDGAAYHFAAAVAELTFPSTDWALPDQLVFSTVSALLRVSNDHPNYGVQATSAIFDFTFQTIARIHSSTCKLC